VTKRTVSWLLLLFAFIGLIGSPAQATEGQRGSTAPATEDSITVYTALEDDQLERYVAVFKKTYPKLTLNLVRDSTGIVTAKVLAEKANPQADAIWGLAASSLLLADKEGLLEAYAPAGLERVDPTFRDSDNPPKWVGIDVWEAALCVNEIELKAKKLPMPTSWADLTNPVYKGQIVMPNPASSGTGYLSVASWVQMMGEEQAFRYLDALHENIAQYMHSGSKPCRAAGAGEFPIGISFGYRAVIQKEKGEPIVPVWPKEGSGWDLEANALVKKPTIKPAARIFLDWAISDAAMKEYAKSFPLTAVKMDVPPPAGYLSDPLKQLAKNDFAFAAGNRERLLQEWSKRYDGKSEPKK
jgi:iron(III) transport system substrate-binding protein